MQIFFTKDAAQHEAILTVFRRIGQYIPSLAGFWNTWPEADFDPGTAGLKLSQILADEFNRLQRQILEQRHQVETLFQSNQRLLEVVDDGPRILAQRELDALQQQLAEARQETLLALSSEQSLKRNQALQQAQHERAIQALEAQLVDHRRLIARQHHELVDLMGEAYAQSLPAQITRS